MKKYYVGIDLGGISAKAGVVDEEGNLLCTVRRETSAENPPERTAEHLAALAEEAIKKSGIGRERVIAIGVGSPGVIDSARGEVVVWSNFHWKNVPLSALVFRDSGLPVWLVNDANAAALGEAKYGSGKNCSDSVTVTLGTGVGGGIVLGGKLFEGFRSAGGELGHMVLRRGGVRCTCGRRGCFECYASATALKRMTREAIGRHPDSLMRRAAAHFGKLAVGDLFHHNALFLSHPADKPEASAAAADINGIEAFPCFQGFNNGIPAEYQGNFLRFRLAFPKRFAGFFIIIRHTYLRKS